MSTEPNPVPPFLPPYPASLREQFAQRPFVAGSMVGLRAFIVNEDATLTGVIYKHAWSADENQAACAVTQVIAGELVTAGWDSKREHDPELGDHELMHLACGCGFWAYHVQRNGYLHPPTSGSLPRVAAIVEGYGKCVVGSLGFRAEKARIVALIMCEDFDERIDWAAIIENYPGVPIYDTVEAALADHPLTPPDDDEIEVPQTEAEIAAAMRASRADQIRALGDALNRLARALGRRAA